MTLGGVAALAAIPGCSDDATDDGAGGAAGAGSGGSNGADGPLYVFSLSVYYQEGTLEYVLLRDTLDFDIDVKALETAREFPGYTGIATIGDYIVTGDSETPFATKWRITSDSKWEQVGDKLNFSEYFTDDGDGLNFYFQSIRGEDMYFFYGADRTSRLHWNVDTWRIVGSYEDTNLPLEAGMVLGNAGNRTGVRDFVGPVVWPFTWRDEATGFTDKSYLAVYDPVTHEEKAVIEVPCPNIQQSTIDEDGNLYFGTTRNDPTPALYGEGPANCVVRVKPDGTLDEDFGAPDLTKWTGEGRYGVNFRYVGGGKALANVVHPERVEGADFDGAFDPDVQCVIWGCESKPELFDSGVWDMHLIDLDGGDSKIVTGFEPAHRQGYYTISHVVDGRVFIAAQVELEVTNNAIYELDLETAEVTRVGNVAGDLRLAARLR